MRMRTSRRDTAEVYRRPPRATGHAGGRNWPLVQVDDSHPDRLQDGLRAVPRVELLVDRRQVVLHGLLADEKALGDFRRRAAIRDELEYLFLTARDDPRVLVGGLVELAN